MSQQKQQSQKNIMSAKWIFAVLVVVVIAFGLGLYFHTCIPFSKENNSTPIETEISNDSKDEKSEFQTNIHEISISNVECGYYLPSSKVATYTADNLIDGNIKTAWAVNLDSPIYDCDALFGPIFTVNCNTVSEVVIVNGYGKDEASFFNNTRAAWITIYRNDNMEGDFPKECDIIYKGALKDTVEPQSLVVSSNFDNSKPTSKIGLIFSTKNSDGYYFGRKWNDLCISEFKVYGNNIGTGKLKTNEQLAKNEEFNQIAAEEQRRLEEEQRQKKIQNPEWLNGTWHLDIDGPNGISVANYTIRINDGYATLADHRTTKYSGECHIKEGDLYLGSSYKFSINGQSLYYRQYRLTKEGGSSSWNGSFRTASDVMRYLCDRTFYSNNHRMAFTYYSVTIDGHTVSGSPIIRNVSSTTATIVVNPIGGGRAAVMYLNASNGSINYEGDIFQVR